MHGSILLGRDIDADYGHRVFTCYLRLHTNFTSPEVQFRLFFCRAAQIPQRISKNNLLNEDKDVRDYNCNPFQQNSRGNFQHRRMVPKSSKIISLYHQFNFTKTCRLNAFYNKAMKRVRGFCNAQSIDGQTLCNDLKCPNYDGVFIHVQSCFP